MNKVIKGAEILIVQNSGYVLTRCLNCGSISRILLSNLKRRESERCTKCPPPPKHASIDMKTIKGNFMSSWLIRRWQ